MTRANAKLPLALETLVAHFRRHSMLGICARRVAAVAAIVPLALISSGLVAHADTGTSSSTGFSGVGTWVETVGGHSVTITGTFNGVATGNTLTETFQCAATATPDAASTAISECSLNGSSAPLLALPGDASATTGTATFSLVNFPGLTLCVAGTGTFVENVTGQQTVSDSECF
jgi:hypothetical protein